MQELDLAQPVEHAVGNAGMEHMAKLPKLLYLNLDNTAVDDDGLKAIATLPELHALTLNETSASPTTA